MAFPSPAIVRKEVEQVSYHSTDFCYPPQETDRQVVSESVGRGVSDELAGESLAVRGSTEVSEAATRTSKSLKTVDFVAH